MEKESISPASGCGNVAFHLEKLKIDLLEDCLEFYLNQIRKNHFNGSTDLLISVILINKLVNLK